MDNISTSSTEKCCCDKSDHSSGSDHSTSDPGTHKDKKSKISLMSLGFNLRRGRSLHFTSKRTKKSNPTDNSSPSTSSNSNVKKSPKWGLKFSCTKSKEPKVTLNTDNQTCCHCSCQKKTDDAPADDKSMSSQIENSKRVQNESLGALSDCGNSSPDPVMNDKVSEASEIDGSVGIYGPTVPGHIIIHGPLLNMTWISSVHEDCDETARLARAREIEQGVEAPPNFRQLKRLQMLYSDVEADAESGQPTRRIHLVCPPDVSVDSLRALFHNHITLKSCPSDSKAVCHTQVDFIHCLVPDLLAITNCSFYWGKMDRYEAERLLDGKPEGTFLLRDSAQEEFLFSVSFRKYGRSLHARIEQWNHKFSFDAHDPGVYTSDTVCGLIEHYKDPSSCMFFEPMLTWPLHRNFTFSLQHLCRAAIVNHLTYDDINNLQLPKSLKNYMKEYHYRQKVRVARFDDDVQWLELRNVSP